MKKLWLSKGYENFALYGPEKLSINQLSTQLKTSRASFYHYFGDIDIFIDELLFMHITICKEFNQKGGEKCHSLFPDLYRELAQFPTALRFSLQLFRNRHIPKYNIVFIKTFELTSYAFVLDLFSKELGLKGTEHEIYNLWLTLAEAWYSRLDPQDLSQSAMQNIAEKVLESIQHLIKSQTYAKIK